MASIPRRGALAGIIGAIGVLIGPFGESEYTITEASTTESDGPLAVAIDIVDADMTVNTPGKVRLTVTNESEQSVTIRNKDVLPFGVLSLAPVAGREQPPSGGIGDAYRLYSPAYEESTYIRTGERFDVDRVDVKEVLEPGDSASAEYHLDAGELIITTGQNEIRPAFDQPLLAYTTDSSTDEYNDLTPRVRLTIDDRGMLQL